MAIVSDRQYRQELSAALAVFSPGIEDLVSNSNPLWNVLKRKGRVRSYGGGPEIRQTLLIDKQVPQWFRAYDFLRNSPIELLNDAVWTPKNVAIPISLSGEEIRSNSGPTQRHDLMTTYLESAGNAMVDAMDEGLHADGTADGGKQLTGLAAALPVDPTTAGVYGGIDRDTVALWRTSAFDADTDFSDIGTQVTSVTIRPMLTRIMGQRSRNTRGADLLIMAEEHYWAYDAALTAIQRVARETELASLGFPSIEYVGGGRKAQIVLASGINNNMPADTTYGLETSSISVRYHPDANFSPLFDGDGQKPINQDAIAQFLIWTGELIVENPLFMWRFFDSDPNT